MDATPDLLRAFPLLKSLDSSALELLASRSSVTKFSRREVVMDPRHHEETVYFVFEGKLQGVDFTIDGREVGLYFVLPFDFCGEISLFSDSAKKEFVIALAQSTIVKIPTAELKKVMERYPVVMKVLGNKLAARIEHLMSQRALLAIANVQQRVCCQLWELNLEKNPDSSHYNQPNREIRLPPTHLEIANMLNISRESVTRVFQTLQNRQIVRRNGASSLLIEDPEALKRLANGEELF